MKLETRFIVTVQVTPRDPDDPINDKALVGTAILAVRDALARTQRTGFTHPLAQTVSVTIQDVVIAPGEDGPHYQVLASAFGLTEADIRKAQET